MLTSRFPFPPDPTGWYHLAESSEVAAGASLRIDALGASLQASRDVAGLPHVTHAARGALPAEDANGSLLAWWDAKGRAPHWHVPAVDACASPEWERVADRRWRLRSHPQEIGENIVDTAHILVLHGADRIPVLTRAEGDGHRFVVESQTPADDPAAAFVTGFRVTEHGLGYATLRFEGNLELCAIARRTPVVDDLVDVRVAFFAKRQADAAATRAIGAAFVARFCAEFDADIPILERKAHLPAPLLCDADGPIPTWRRWCRQFYV